MDYYSKHLALYDQHVYNDNNNITYYTIECYNYLKWFQRNQLKDHKRTWRRHWLKHVLNRYTSTIKHWYHILWKCVDYGTLLIIKHFLKYIINIKKVDWVWAWLMGGCYISWLVCIIIRDIVYLFVWCIS